MTYYERLNADRMRKEFWAHKRREAERAKIIEAAMFPVDKQSQPS